MKISKKYKFNKIKFFLKSKKLILIYHTSNLKLTEWLKTEKKLKKNNLKCYKLNNKLVQKALNKSNLLNFSKILKGPLCFVTINNNKGLKQHFNNLIKFNKIMLLLAIKLNRKVYSFKQINNLTTLSYSNIIKTFNKILNNSTKILYHKFKNKNSK